MTLTTTGAAPMDSVPGWAGARWVTAGQATTAPTTVTMLRHEFELPDDAVSATVRVHGLGLYELRLDGTKVGDLQLTPLNGRYDRHTLYDRFTLGSLDRGRHAIGVWLADGYGSRFSRYAFRWLGPHQAVLHLRAHHADGTTTDVVSSPGWRTMTAPGFTSDLYDGEHFDARQVPAGWDRAGFDDRSWDDVVAVTAPAPAMVPHTGPKIRVVETLTPVTMSNPGDGVWIFDLGQNVSGWPQLMVDGPAGTTVQLRTAEELTADGMLDVATNRDAAATDTYTLHGDGTETWEPRFTYHGFRYVEATGLPHQPTAATVSGRVVHTDLQERGRFSCSDTVLTTIWENHRWTQRANSMGLPTDTPVRDERTPPAMDVQAYGDAAMWNYQMAKYYEKYLLDLAPGEPLPSDDHQAQQPDMAGGQVCLPWTIYTHHGDSAVLEHHYPAMARFVTRNAADVPHHIWPDDAGFGDWCPPDPRAHASAGLDSPVDDRDNGSERSLVNTALAFRQAQTVARAAEALGLTDDARRHHQLATDIADAFHAHFARPDGRGYGSGRQVTSILPLAFVMVPPSYRDAVIDQLVRSIVADHDTHLDTGIFGTAYLLDALAAAGHIDLGLAVLRAPGYPGFRHQIDLGATTAWEQWSYRAGMQTHNHAMFTGISASFYTVLAGITPTAPGFASVSIRPQIPQGLERVDGRVETVRGLVVASWQQDGDALELSVEVPSAVHADIELPCAPNASVHADASVKPVSSPIGTARFVLDGGSARITVSAVR